MDPRARISGVAVLLSESLLNVLSEIVLRRGGWKTDAA